MSAKPGLTVALPRSSHHVALLIENGAAPERVLCRDPALMPLLEDRFPGQILAIGRECRPGASPAALLRARRANHRYYAELAAMLAALPIERLILFLEGEPLERFIVDRCPGAQVELWEDGLSHYVDLTSPLWYAARGLVQAAAGFYPRHIVCRRMDRRMVRVRDRFAEGSLTLAVPPVAASAESRPEVLFIGSPLVEDGIVSKRRFVTALRAIAAESPLPVRYLPHPRENAALLRASLAAASPDIHLETADLGLLGHAARHRYRAYVAALSTGLLDLGRHDRSLFVPALFGLRRAARVLADWPANPVRVIADAAALRCALGDLARLG